MDINRLHYFCTVAQTGSISKAAELLHISQAALSKPVKTLELELDEVLVVPAGRGIAITDTGLRLLKEALPLVEQVMGLKSKLTASSQTRAKMRIGSFEVFTTYFLKDLMDGVFKDFSLNIFECVPGEIETALKSHDIDLGISYLPIPDPELDFLKVSSIEMGVFVKKNSFKNTDLLSLEFIVPNTLVKGTPSKVQGLDGWPDNKYPRKIIHRVAMLEGALVLCRSGYGAGYFPKHVVARHNDVVKSQYQLSEVSIPKSMKVQTKQDVYVIKRKTDTEDAFMKKLSKQLRLI